MAVYKHPCCASDSQQMLSYDYPSKGNIIVTDKHSRQEMRERETNNEKS